MSRETERLTHDPSRRFLQLFTEIEEFLAKRHSARLRPDNFESFSTLVTQSDELLVRSERDFLISAGRLRNAIVHQPYKEDRPIADPRADVITKLDGILQNLTKPLLVSQVLALVKPQIFALENRLSDIAALINPPTDFSQMPVRDEEKFRLITTNAIARWYVDGWEREGGQVEDPTIMELLKFAELGDSVRVMPKAATAISVIRAFAGSAGSIAPAAILLTETGMPQHTAVGMCVRADVGDLYRALENRATLERP